jgi:hypothetical protein
MTYLLPKARMHPVERWAMVAGLGLMGVGAALAGALLPLGSLLPAAISLACMAWFAANPAGRVEYQFERDGLRIGEQFVPFYSLREARVVNLRGTILYGGAALPGCWWGRAWSPRLGRFTMRGSTGVGRGVLLVTADGERLVITPQYAERTVVCLQVMMRQQVAPRPLALWKTR